MEKYGIVFKNRDAATVYYDGTIDDVIEMLENCNMVSMTVCGMETWKCGEDKTTKMKQILFRCEEVSAVYYDEVENEED